jgi:cobalt-zinc-cadmium resistance protein CzcA
LISRLIEFSVRNRALVLLLAVVFVLLGVASALKLPIDAVPDVANVQVQIITAAPALGPVDVESYVTVPVETSMGGLPDVTEIRSLTRPGISVVTVVFGEDTDVEHARRLVSERLARARELIPPGYGSPTIGPLIGSLSEVFHFEVRGPGHSLMERRAVLERQIAPRLRLVPGVVEVNTFGGEARSMQVELDPSRMAAAHIGVPDVVTAIERNHAAAGGAYLVDGREQLTVRAEARVASLDDLGLINVELRHDRTPVYLRDLGAIREAPLVRYGAVTRDGRGETVVGVVMMRLGQNSADVCARARATLDDVAGSLPAGITIDAYYDRRELVRRTIRTVETNLVEASLLVIVVLFLTLVSFRAGSLVAAAIPLALLGAFIGMRAAGVSGNLMSLGAIDFGLVVDGAIIIVENAQRHLALRREQLGRALTDRERSDAVLEASREVRGATAFGEAIIALVYLPILALEGIEGKMFRPMALTVLFALASAFVLSLTVVPALASLVLARDARDRHSPIIVGAAALYRPALRGAMNWPRATALAALATFALSLFVGGRMGREFLPTLDEGTIVAPTVRLPSASLDQSVTQALQIERVLRSFPDVRSVVSRTGRAEIAIDPMGTNMTDVYILLRPRSEWRTAHDREGLVRAFDRALTARVPGIGFSYSQPIEMNTSDLLAGIQSDVAVHIYGNDLTVLRQLAERTVRVLRGIPGSADVRAEQVAGLSVLTAHVDRVGIARQGLDARAVLDTVAATGGIEAGVVLDGLLRVPIVVRLGPDARRSPEALGSVPVRTPGNAMVPLGQLAQLRVEPGPPEISRERLQRRVTVQANVRGRDLGSFVEAARAAVEREVRLPTGYTRAWAGEYEHLQSATARLLVVVPIALLLILVLLIATFGRLRPALLIFLNVPIAVTGGVFALRLRGMDLSIAAGVGFIALFGVAVLNGLVLLSSVERLRATGMSVRDAVVQGSEGRLRAVLTTALVASLGFVPMALSTGAGAEVQRPVATVVIGGIVSATLLTLLVLPAVYAWVARREGEPRAPEAASE